MRFVVLALASTWFSPAVSAAAWQPEVQAGLNYTCARDADGVKCWGQNEFGQTNVPALNEPTQISINEHHSCALTQAGVKCWGQNTYQQLDIPALATPKGVAVGGIHTCALDAAGVKCWGYNADGQSTVPALSAPTQVTTGGNHSCALDAGTVKCWGIAGPTAVPALNQPRFVAGGFRHSCALDADGVKCWGDNASGQITVPALRQPTQVSTGTSHTCALDADGVKCWGLNTSGQTTVPALNRPITVSAGSAHTCAIDADGVKCWGNNGQGQTTPPASIDFTERHSCWNTAGGVRCVGGNSYGQLGAPGDGGGAARDALPLRLGSDFRTVTQVAVGRGFGCALSNEGVVKCFGKNGYGQLGNGDTQDRGRSPDDMGDAMLRLYFDDNDVQAIGVGGSHACAIADGSRLYCWGFAGKGQLGLETTTDGLAPRRVSLNAGNAPKQLALGKNHSCFVNEAGEVYCFGSNEFGQNGSGKGDVGGSQGTMGENLKPVALGAGFRAQAVASGQNHACALSDLGAVKCWGQNDVGQLGVGDVAARGLTPESMGDALPFANLGENVIATDLACGRDHCCVTTVAQTMKCWGGNHVGQLGLGDTLPRGPKPETMGDDLPFVPLPPREKVSRMDLNWMTTCATTESGKRCWGSNGMSELGYGDKVGRGGTLATIPRVLPPLGI